MYHIQSMAHVKSYLISHHAYYMLICFSLDVRFPFCHMKPVRWVCYVCVWIMMAYGWSLISSESKLCQRSVCMWCDLTCFTEDTYFGTIYTSDDRGILYSKSLERHLFGGEGKSDFTNVTSLRGVYLTNILEEGMNTCFMWFSLS